MHIGPYEVQGELGRGGMGVVYRARDAALEREVAVKVVTLSDPELTTRLLREGRAAARLRHPNIVAVHGLGQAQGRPYLVLDLVQGEGLDARLRREGPLAVADAVRLVATIARAVEYAHGQGVVHRDLKPGNVVLDERGAPHVLDFGLARVLDDALRATATGELLGSPGYMAPEQAGGERDRIGATTDVYGLGATLYALLTGRPPFHGHTGVAALRAILEDEPAPVSAARPEVTPALAGIVERALAKDPARRWPSAGALAEALDRWLAPPAAPARRAAPALGVAAAAASALLGAGLAWVVASREVERLGDRLDAVTEQLETARLEAARATAASRASDDAALESASRARAVMALEREGALHLALARPHAAAEALAEAAASDGDDPDLLTLLALAHARAARLTPGDGQHAARAQECLATALQRDPDHVPALVASLRLRDGPPDRIRSTLAAERARSSRWAAAAAAEHGLTLLRAGDDFGPKVALKAAAADAWCPRTVFLEGALRLRDSDAVGAYDALWRAARLDPTDVAVWRDLADACRAAGRQVDELSVRSTLRRVHGVEQREADNRIVDLHMLLGDFEGASRQLERMAQTYHDRALLCDAAVVEAAAGHREHAMRLLLAAVDGEPGARAVEAYAAQAWFWAADGQVDAARNALSNVESVGASFADEQRAWPTVARAAILVQSEETRAEGERLLTELLAAGRGPALVARRVRMQARLQLGRAADAVDDAQWLVRALGARTGSWGADALEVLVRLVPR